MLRIEICGGIASGKTTLAGLLTRLHYKVLFENFQENPFWKAFYTNPGKHIFETEVTFLLQHYHLIKAASAEGNMLVCDFSFLLDGAYADIGLDGSKKGAFDRVYQEVWQELGPPDLLILLRCDASVELARIRARGRSVESSIDEDFLERLNEAVYKRFEEMRSHVPTLEIDSAEENFATSEPTRKRIAQRIDSLVARLQSSTDSL